MIKSLFAYPGNKAKLIQTLNIPADTQVFIDPFFGGGSFTFEMIKRSPSARFIVAESDPNIRMILRSCRDSVMKSEVLKKVECLKKDFDQSPDKTWQSIKQEMILGDAASKLLHQRLAFGAVARTGSNGVYNVIYSKDKAANLSKWKPSLPDLRWVDLAVLNDWRFCFNIPGVDYQDAIAFVDPPYYAPGKTACYPGHKPKDIMTLLTVINSVEAALAARVSKFWLTHYDVELLQDFLNGLDDSEYAVKKTIGDTLDQLGKGIGNHKHGGCVKKKVVYRDCVWNYDRLPR